jgi:hypothetical protein
MKKRYGSHLASGLLFAALSLGVPGSGNAIIYKGHIDPTFHAGGTAATGTDLGWSADIILDLEGCADNTGFTTCTTMDLDSAIGTLYDTTDPGHTPISTPSTLTYYAGPPSGAFIQSVLFDANGDLLGINTSPIGAAFAQASSTFLPPNGAANLWLQFVAPNPNTLTFAALDVPQALGGYLIVSPCGVAFIEDQPSFFCSSDPGTGVVSDTATVTFVAVPEPAPMLLMLAALFAMALAGRGWRTSTAKRA